MEVSFKGILKAYIPAETATHVQIPKRFIKAQEFENVLNVKPQESYSELEEKKIRIFTKQAARDYIQPDPKQDEEYNKQAGIYRFSTRDAIYYLTGKDIEEGKKKQEEIKQMGLKGVAKDNELKKFIKEKEEEAPLGFIALDSTGGERFDVITVGGVKSGNFLNCEFLYL